MIYDISAFIATCVVIIIAVIASVVRTMMSDNAITGSADIATLPDDILAREYTRWSMLNKYYLKNAKKLTERQKYEFKNILERYVISSANVVAKSPNDSGADTLLCIDDAAIDRMNKELAKHKITTLSDTKNNTFVELIESYLKLRSYAPITAQVTKDDTKVIIACGDFNYTLTRRRYDTLFNRSNDNDAIACMLLRYECLFPGGQQWGSSESKYTMLHDKYNVRLEGFASPKNSQLIYHDDSYFCSLFYDTDKIFGSRGSYFGTNFTDFAAEYTKLPYVGIAVCPPYILHIMDDAMRKIMTEIQSAKDANVALLVLFLCPNWTDTEYIRIGEQAACKCYDKQLPAMQHTYVNTSAIDDVTNEPPIIMARFPSRMFAFSTDNFELPNFDELTDTYLL